ncbi:hypothetical protein HMPREF3191_01143 [Veillonellaceae bacterium DNF00626]|nr:hypothetical protein HMPREF3191_01143 [Veillonellaceae bacterium DNF00626]
MKRDRFFIGQDKNLAQSVPISKSSYKNGKKVVKKSHFITVWNNLYKKIAIMTQGGYNQNRRKENFRRPVKSHNRI